MCRVTHFVLLLLAAMASMQGTLCVRYQGTTDPDFVRAAYVQMEKSLWEKYVDKVSSLTQNERLYKLFNQHYVFVQQNLDSNYEGSDYKVLARFYEWSVIETDIINIHNLFQAFKQHLVRELESHDKHNEGGFDERASLDLTETVLHDSLWPINGTIEKIQNVIFSQGLYYKAVSVRSLPSHSLGS